MHDLVNVVLPGIIEGITEFLPVSSTGHLLIAEHWLGARSDLFNVGIPTMYAATGYELLKVLRHGGGVLLGTIYAGWLQNVAA